MITKFPVDFKSRVQNGSDAQISANDLMNNFSAAFIEIDQSLVSDVASPSGHTQRKLKIPGIPASGSTVLSAISGGLQWTTMPTATTSAPTSAPTGPSIPTAPSSGNYVLSSINGSLTWRPSVPTAPPSGTYVLGSVTGSVQWLTTISC
jgi:hypothetical protein